MKKILLAACLLVGAASLHAASPFQQDTTMHKKMQHKKMSSDTSMHKTWNKSDSSMHHKAKGGKMKKDSSK
jgi:hypothetical protein